MLRHVALKSRMADELAQGDLVYDIDADERLQSDDEEEALAADGGEEEDDSLHCFSGHTGPVYAVAWQSGSARNVASGGGDERAFLWQTGAADFQSLERTTLVLRGHSDTVSCLEFNHDGRLLASGGLDGQVRIWSSSDASCLHVLDGPTGSIEWLSWHPKGNIVLAGSEDFMAWMWNAVSGAFMQVFTGHNGPVRCGLFTPDGKHIATGGGEGDESLKLWDPRTGACSLTVQDPHTYHNAGLTVLAIHPESTLACSGSEDATARLVNLQTGRVVGTFTGHTDSIEAVAFIRNLPLVATASVDGSMRIWETSTCTVRAICPHDEAVICLACHPSLPIAYTGCLDGCLRCWDLRSGACLHTKRGHTQGIQDLAVSPDGTLVITGSDDCTARIFQFDMN